MRFKSVLPVAMTVVLLAAPGCLGAGPVARSNSRPLIVATTSMLGSIASELVGDRASIIVSIPNGLDPHQWEPSAKDIENLNRADLVLENGLGLESGMLRALRPLGQKRGSGVKFFTATDHIIVRHVGLGEGVPSGDPDQAVGAADPHFWTDPLAMKSVAAALAETLKTQLGIDVSAEAASLESRLAALDDEIVSMVAAVPPEQRKLVTGHESMGYFSERYGFKLVGVIVPSLSSQAEASAADIAALKKTVQENGVSVVFSELGTSSKVAETIGTETGARVVGLATHTLPPDGSYLTFMRRLASTIVGALR